VSDRYCEVCSAPFTTKRNKLTCSEPCRKVREAKVDTRERHRKRCVVCKKRFERDDNHTQVITCSPECRQKRKLAKRAEAQRRYRQSHPDYYPTWKKNNPEKGAALMREWRAKNPGRANENLKRHRAKKRKLIDRFEEFQKAARLLEIVSRQSDPQ